MDMNRLVVAAALTLAVILAGAPGHRARAQLLPQVQLPTLPQLQLPTALPSVAGEALRDVRALRVRELLRRHPRELDRDPRGALILRGVFLALSPSEAALAGARGAGFTVQGERELAGLGERVVTLLAPGGWSARRGLARLRALDPQGRYDFNHLYIESASEATPATAPRQGPVAAARSPGEGRIGLIDSGVSGGHPALRNVAIASFGCGGASVPAAHGTAVASLLVGSDGVFRGAAPGAQLYAADVYCGSETGGRVDEVVQSLAWLAGAGVPVVNISLVGPPNLVLEAVVRSVLARGMVLVAAVGNDGPAARPLYPASYPGVIGVTAVDGRDRVLLEAGAGPQVMFAAPGADIVAATVAGGYAPVRGTSFAAPLVAGLLINQSITDLSSKALDLGAKGPDKRFGRGLVGEDLRAGLTTK